MDSWKETYDKELGDRWGAKPGAPRAEELQLVDRGSVTVPNGTTFPQLCVKCGAYGRLVQRKQRFVRSHRFGDGFILIGRLASRRGGLRDFLSEKQSEFTFPLCTECSSNWRKWNGIHNFSMLLALFLFGLFESLLDHQRPVAGILGFVGTFAAIPATGYIRRKYIVRATKIDATHSRLEGVHPTVARMVAETMGSHAMKRW